MTHEAPDLTGLDRPIKRTLRDQIHLQLRAAIMAGRFQPGQHLGITALATALNVSAMPVREALRQLVAEGALEMLPNRQVKVPVLTPDGFRDILGVRLLLEGDAAARAAQHVSPELLGRLALWSEEMRACFATRDVPRYFSLNQSFHFDIYRAAGSDALMRHIELLWLRTGPVIRLVSLTEQGFIASEKNHARIIAALQAQDSAAAAEALRADLRDAATVIETLRALDAPTASLGPLDIERIA